MDMEKTETITKHTLDYHKKSQMHFNGAVFIDKAGNEISITEAMIQNACKNLHEAWNSPQVQND